MSETSRFLIIVFSALFSASCGGDGASYRYASEVKFWQSYSASPEGGVHYWNEGAPYVVSKLDRVNDEFRSGFAFVDPGGRLIFDNLATGEKFHFFSGVYQAMHAVRNKFIHKNFVFDHRDGYVRACRDDDIVGCATIQIAEGTFPYVYAEANDKVLVITNWGGVEV